MVRKTKRSPGERAGLARADILRATRRLLGEEGIDGVTIRRIASALGVAPNAIYGHYDDKDGLLDDLVDDLLGTIQTAGESADGRDALVRILRATRALLAEHPSLVPLALSRPGRGPNATRLGEAMLQALARLGVEGPRAVEAFRVLLVYTLGFSAFDAPRKADANPDERRRKSQHAFETSGHEKMAALAPTLARHADDATFEAGLAWLLDGIERVSRRA